MDEEDKWTRPEPLYYYLANVAYMVYLTKFTIDHMFDKHSRNPDMKFADFVLDFEKAMKLKEAKDGEEKPARRSKDESAESPVEWDENSLEVEDMSEDEYQARRESANLNAHNRWASFLGVTLSEVGAADYVKSPVEAPRIE